VIISFVLFILNVEVSDVEKVILFIDAPLLDENPKALNGITLPTFILSRVLVENVKTGVPLAVVIPKVNDAQVFLLL